MSEKQLAGPSVSPGQKFQSIAWRHEDGALYVSEDGQGSEQDAGRVLRAAWERYERARTDLENPPRYRTPEIQRQRQEEKRAALTSADSDIAAAVDFFDMFCPDSVWKEYALDGYTEDKP